MVDLANLPADISPHDFFEAVQSALASEPAPPDATDDKVVVHLDGDGGGRWVLGFEDGELGIAEGTAEAPPLQLSITVDDWRAFVAGSVRDAVAERVGSGFDTGQASQIYKLTAKTEQIKQFSGNLQLVLNTPEGPRKATVTFGGGAPDTSDPQTTVTASLDDFVAMAAGELDAQTAFMTGKIAMDGDMNLAMSLMALAAN